MSKITPIFRSSIFFSFHMRTEFNVQESIINYLVLHSMDSPNEVGLFRGQMGYVIALSKYARQHNIPQLETIADFICDNVFSRAGALRDISFATGLSGICWGIEYLVQEGILDGNAEASCSDVDAEIMKTDVSRVSNFSLESGLGGLWLYVRARLQGNHIANLKAPFDNEYLEKWIWIIDSNPAAFPPDSKQMLTDCLNGSMKPVKISVGPFIEDFSDIPTGNLSLVNGIAGYMLKAFE